MNVIRHAYMCKGNDTKSKKRCDNVNGILSPLILESRLWFDLKRIGTHQKKSIHWKNDKVFAASKSGKHIKKAYDDFFNRVEKSYVIWMKGFGYFALSCITSAQPMNMLMAI